MLNKSVQQQMDEKMCRPGYRWHGKPLNRCLPGAVVYSDKDPVIDPPPVEDPPGPQPEPPPTEGPPPETVNPEQAIAKERAQRVLERRKQNA